MSGRDELAPLFQPIRLGALDLPHRVAMAPMTRYMTPQDGCIGDLSVTYYRQRASAAMIVAETSYVHPTGRIGSFIAGLCTPVQIEAWRRATDAVHAAGGLMVAQLMHGGRFSHHILQPDGRPPPAPSAVAIDPPERVRTASGDLSTEAPRELAQAEIDEIVEAYAQAARNARTAGFDAVELHAGNGYLPSQFLSSRANRRTDGYGGSAADRARFALEVTDAIARAVGADRTAVKVSPFITMHGALDPAETQETHAVLLRELARRDLAYVHVQLQFDFVPMRPQPFDSLALARSCYPGRLVGSGGFDRSTAARAVAEARCDVVAFGRRFAASPDLPQRFRTGAAENVLDAATLVGNGPDPGGCGYIDYPLLVDEEGSTGCRTASLQ